MPTVVVPAASASRIRRPSLFKDASHKPPVGFYLFLFKTSSVLLTTDAGLYVVLNGDLSTPPKASGDVLQAGRYDKNKNQEEKTRQTKKRLKTPEKRHVIMTVAASLALGTLSILAGRATALKPNVFDTEPKALWGLCMYSPYLWM
jgi:hypothetical protein